MAAITTQSHMGTFKQIRSGSAQANTGQTDWLGVPAWARSVEVDIDVNAVAGTTPILTPALLSGNTTTFDDADAIQMHGNFTTPPTAASRNVISLGPDVAAADDLALSATGFGSGAVVAPLPSLLGVQCVLDRGTGDETYTYTVSVKFRR